MPSFSLYSSPDLKVAADEALPFVLDSFEYQQIHYPAFVRLGAGWANAAIAGGLFFAERKFEWQGINNWIIIAVALHAFFLAFSYLWQRFVEKNATYIGVSKTGEKVYIQTHAPKRDETYTITVLGPKGTNRKVVAKFSEFFDYNGQIVRNKFEPVLAGLLGHTKKDQ